MRYLIYYVIVIGVCVVEVSSTWELIRNIVERCDKLKKINEKRIEAVKLYDFEGNKLNALASCITRIILSGLLCVIIYFRSRGVAGLIETIMCLAIIVSMFVNAGVGILIYRHTGECYLTYGGIVKVDWTYGRNECKFATQIEDLKDGKKRLSVVVSKYGSVVPLKFGVMERQNDAIEIVNSFNCK